MTVLVNIVASKFGGGVTLLRALVAELARLPPRHRFVFFVSPEQADPGFPLPSHLEWRVPPAGPTGPLRRLWWDQIAMRRLLRREGADVLYSLGNFAMLRCPVPQLLLVQTPVYLSDLYRRACLAQWDWRYRARYRLRRWLLCRSVAAADLVLVPSDTMREMLRREMPQQDGKVKVNYLGPGLGPGARDPRDYHGPIRLLYPTYYGDYKNAGAALEAVKLLRQQQGDRYRLVTTADLSENRKQANPRAWAREHPLWEKLRQQGAIESLGLVRPEAMQDLYRSCHLLVWPTLAESFGFPLVEAMACGLPVVASDIPVNRELAGDAALYFDPMAPAELAARVREIVENPALRQSLEERGRRRGAAFSWKRHAEQLVEILESLARTSAAREAAR